MMLFFVWKVIFEDTMQRCDYADVFPSRGDEDGGMVANFAHIDTGRQTWK